MYLTGTEEEDEECRLYEASLAAYNGADAALEEERPSKYKRGSLMQRLLDPFAGAPRDEDGAIVYNLKEDELKEHDFENR